MNPSTNYQNGVDFHLDWGVSQFLSKQFLVGLVGYVYDQVSGDSGSGDKVGPFESPVEPMCRDGAPGDRSRARPILCRVFRIKSFQPDGNLHRAR
jgi:hypothetical protein